MRPRVLEEFQQASDYYRHQRVHSRSFQRQRDVVLSMLGRGHGRVLDLGSGPALLAADVVSRGYAYVAVDLGIEILWTEARAESRRVAVVAEAEQLPFVDGSFAAVIAMGMLEYVLELDRALQEIARVLAPGGPAIVTVPHASAPRRRFDLTRDAVRSCAKRLLLRSHALSDASTMCNILPPRQWREAANAARFELVEDGFCSYGALPESLCGLRPLRALGTQYVMKLVPCEPS